jgi:integrase
MSVRKHHWVTRKGERREAWIAAYSDGQGDRHVKFFERKKDADAFHDSVRVDVKLGIHTAPSKSVTVREAGALWLQSGENAELERATLRTYQMELKNHILPLLGNEKLSSLTTAAVRSFEDKLRAKGCSTATRRWLIVSLGSLIADAQERGLVMVNAVRGLRRSRRGKEERREQREKAKLRVGIDIPTPEEIKRIIAHLTRHRPLLLTAIFTGLRASELRGLRWEDVDLKKGELHVRQRADRFGVIGRLKSGRSERIIPLPPMLVSELRAWKLACPKGELGLAFPTSRGTVAIYQNILTRGFFPAQIAAGVVTNGGRQKYTGLHSLRHFFASWCINRKADGGLELPMKVVQERLGHSTITLTADRYSHLFPRGDDGGELAAAEALLRMNPRDINATHGQICQ